MNYEVTHRCYFSLPVSVEMLCQLKLPSKLISLIDSFNGTHWKSTVSSSTSSSSVSLAATSNSQQQQHEFDIQTREEMSLHEWITAQVRELISIIGIEMNLLPLSGIFPIVSSLNISLDSISNENRLQMTILDHYTNQSNRIS